MAIHDPNGTIKVDYLQSCVSIEQQEPGESPVTIYIDPANLIQMCRNVLERYNEMQPITKPKA